MPNKYYGNMCFSETYKDKQTGQEKKKWHVFGQVFQGDQGGMSVHIPLFDKWFAIFKQEPKQNNGGNQQNYQNQGYQQQQPNTLIDGSGLPDF